ncbi:MAG: hypothetical protein L0Y56_22605, partial [Nitrospira sp.]|nr:hypothetical protein [Nitrospira sp.]
MNIHEYQAKELFKQYGIPVPRGKSVGSLDEAKAWADELSSQIRESERQALPVRAPGQASGSAGDWPGPGGIASGASRPPDANRLGASEDQHLVSPHGPPQIYVVKAQIHAGGRGKAGGVKLAKNQAEMARHAGDLLGKTLVTHQTGPAGRKVHRLLIEEGVQIEKELYLSILLDRSMACPVVVASAAGGMEIEEVATESPEKVLKMHIDPVLGVQAFHGRTLAFKMGLGQLV